MASILKVDTIQDQSGNNIINESGDTITIGASGDTVNIVGTLQNGGTNFLQGITEADQFRLTANLSSDASPISSNLERVDDATFSKIGTGMSLSAGIYTFPQTGLYLVTITGFTELTNDNYGQLKAYASSDSGSSYDEVCQTSGGNSNGFSSNTSTVSTFINVTNASTFRFKVDATSLTGGNFAGSTTTNQTCFTFIRLGDSQ